MGHHKKNLRAEKAKVKLKGAKLPKGLNVTKTDFKVRKITIRGQLKDSQTIDGQRLISLKEILNRLKHHGTSFRIESLRHLKELIAAEDPRILSNLNELMQGICSLCLDVDRETRRESFKVLNNFLAALNIEAIAPFFNIISSYLRCAMTHIQPTIQEDSMLMLDVLLSRCPSLVTADSGKILQNFLEIISKERAEGDKSWRTLTVNIGSKQTSIKWRSKILQRLQHMLRTLATNNESKGTTGIRTCNSNFRRQNPSTHTFNNKMPQYFSLIRYFDADELDLSALFCKSVNNSFLGGATTVSFVNDAQLLRQYVAHLMPLLFESWAEVRPQTTDIGDHVLVTEDTAITLKIVLEIIESIWTLADIHEKEVNNRDFSLWLCNEYADTFAIKFLPGSFPYQQIDKKFDDSKKGDAPRFKSKRISLDYSTQFCIQQNLAVSFLMSRFYGSNLTGQMERFNELLKYLALIVSHLKEFLIEDFTYLEKSLRCYLYTNGLTFLQDNKSSNIRLLLENTMKAFLANEFPNKENINSKVLVLLCDIAQKSELIRGYGLHYFNEFINYLPKLLLRPSVTEQALLSMISLSKQRDRTFSQALAPLIVPVIENIQKIQIHGTCNALEGKKHIMNLFYWLSQEETWNKKQRSQLKEKIEDCITDKRIKSYFEFIICSENSSV